MVALCIYSVSNSISEKRDASESDCVFPPAEGRNWRQAAVLFFNPNALPVTFLPFPGLQAVTKTSNICKESDQGCCGCEAAYLFLSSVSTPFCHLFLFQGQP